MKKNPKVEDLTLEELREFVQEYEVWYQKEYGFSLLELRRREKEMREHPERGIPHEEAMASLREDRPARNFEELNRLLDAGEKLVATDHHKTEREKILAAQPDDGREDETL